MDDESLHKALDSHLDCLIEDIAGKDTIDDVVPCSQDSTSNDGTNEEITIPCAQQNIIEGDVLAISDEKNPDTDGGNIILFPTLHHSDDFEIAESIDCSLADLSVVKSGNTNVSLIEPNVQLQVGVPKPSDIKRLGRSDLNENVECKRRKMECLSQSLFSPTFVEEEGDVFIHNSWPRYTKASNIDPLTKASTPLENLESRIGTQNELFDDQMQHTAKVPYHYAETTPLRLCLSKSQTQSKISRCKNNCGFNVPPENMPRCEETIQKHQGPANIFHSQNQTLSEFHKSPQSQKMKRLANETQLETQNDVETTPKESETEVQPGSRPPTPNLGSELKLFDIHTQWGPLYLNTQGEQFDIETKVEHFLNCETEPDPTETQDERRPLNILTQTEVEDTTTFRVLSNTQTKLKSPDLEKLSALSHVKAQEIVNTEIKEEKLSVDIQTQPGWSNKELQLTESNAREQVLSLSGVQMDLEKPLIQKQQQPTIFGTQTAQHNSTPMSESRQAAQHNSTLVSESKQTAQHNSTPVSESKSQFGQSYTDPGIAGTEALPQKETHPVAEHDKESLILAQSCETACGTQAALSLTPSCVDPILYNVEKEKLSEHSRESPPPIDLKISSRIPNLSNLNQIPSLLDALCTGAFKDVQTEAEVHHSSENKSVQEPSVYVSKASPVIHGILKHAATNTLLQEVPVLQMQSQASESHSCASNSGTVDSETLSEVSKTSYSQTIVSNPRKANNEVSETPQTSDSNTLRTPYLGTDSETILQKPTTLPAPQLKERHIQGYQDTTQEVPVSINKKCGQVISQESQDPFTINEPPLDSNVSVIVCSRELFELTSKPQHNPLLDIQSSSNCEHIPVITPTLQSIQQGKAFPSVQQIFARPNTEALRTNQAISYHPVRETCRSSKQVPSRETFSHQAITFQETIEEYIASKSDHMVPQQEIMASQGLTKTGKKLHIQKAKCLGDVAEQVQCFTPAEIPLNKSKVGHKCVIPSGGCGFVDDPPPLKESALKTAMARHEVGLEPQNASVCSDVKSKEITGHESALKTDITPRESSQRDEHTVPQTKVCLSDDWREASLYGEAPKDKLQTLKPTFQWNCVYDATLIKSSNDTPSEHPSAPPLGYIQPFHQSQRPLRVGLSRKQKVKHLHESM